MTYPIYKAFAERLQYRPGWALHVWKQGHEYTDVLLSDGNWQTVANGEVTPTNAGLILPDGAWQAIVAEAAPHADLGEVKELRRALDLAESRVQQVIDKALA